LNVSIQTPNQVKLLLQKARAARKDTKKFFFNIAKKKGPEIDKLFHPTHDKVFSQTNCLVCANCCKTSSPIITNKDIDRIANHLRIKPGDFVRDYLKIDEEEDYVFQKTPCTFLNEDNTCSIYEYRPKACSEYPHTNRKNMVEILSLTEKNALVCPAVFNIIELINEATNMPK